LPSVARFARELGWDVKTAAGAARKRCREM
jgi:hypothetical protein